MNSTMAKIFHVGLHDMKARQWRLTKTSPGWTSDHKRNSVRAAAIFRYYPEKYPRHVTGRRNIHALLHGITVNMMTQV